jgi:hypothetical protein
MRTPPAHTAQPYSRAQAASCVGSYLHALPHLKPHAQQLATHDTMLARWQLPSPQQAAPTVHDAAPAEMGTRANTAETLASHRHTTTATTAATVISTTCTGTTGTATPRSSCHAGAALTPHGSLPPAVLAQGSTLPHQMPRRKRPSAAGAGRHHGTALLTGRAAAAHGNVLVPQPTADHHPGADNRPCNPSRTSSTGCRLHAHCCADGQPHHRLWTPPGRQTADVTRSTRTNAVSRGV